MAIDAVFPAASELVMLYGGALASGALAHELVVFGTERSGFGAYLAVVARRDARLPRSARSAAGRSASTAASRSSSAAAAGSTSTRRGSSAPSAGSSAGRTGRSSSAALTPVVRSFVSIPAGVFEAPLAPLHAS